MQRINSSCIASVLAAIASTAMATPPAVSSAELVAHFTAETPYLTLDAAGNVLAWRSVNDPAIVLTAQGTMTPGNIRFEPSGLGGLGSIVVRDRSGENRFLRGSLNRTGTLSDATIYWVGQYQPGADGSLGDSAGQYVYCLGQAGAQGSQMDHQIDDGFFELYGGAGTQIGRSIAYLNNYNSVWRTDYFSGMPGHEATANGVDLRIPPDGGYAVQASHDLVLFGWQNRSGVVEGYNFVGQISDLFIYAGRIDDNDGAAMQSYLAGRLDREPPAAPEPPAPVDFTVRIAGTPGPEVPPGYFPHGNAGLRGQGRFSFDPSRNTMDFAISLEDTPANRYTITQAHFYNPDIKRGGDSIFCWGGRWSSHDFLEGTGFTITPSQMRSILENPERWVLVLHTEGGHFAVDDNGDLIPYDRVVHEVSELGVTERFPRFNNRVPRRLDNRLLREANPHRGFPGDPAFDAVYPDPDHFLRIAPDPFPDANGNTWIRFNDALGRYVPSDHGAARGLTIGEIDTIEYLFYRYDDQGPDWDYGGPEGAAGGILVPMVECRADIDGDGQLTIFDFLAFQNLFAAGDLQADFDGDGELTIFDFLEFQNAFAAGCE